MDLVIEHLWKTYPNGVVALRDVSLTIPPGLFGLLGPNGAGKSTLMRILATLQEADAGSARLGSIDVLRDREAVRRTLGYLPQEFGLYPKATAEAMLGHFALLKGITHAGERRETVGALLQQTNLYGARRQKLGSFSGGMRQRFGIAVALIGSPRLIIVDEPTAGLDPAERARFLNLLSELGENAVVILSTHIVEDVSDLCTRMAIIESGRILLEGEPARAVDAVRGRVWRRQVERADLPRWEQAMPVISTTLVGGRTVIHVFGDAAPDPSFEPVEPDLKDVYFTVIRGIRIGGEPVAAPAPVVETDTASSVDSPPAIAAVPGVEPATASPGDEPAAGADGGAARSPSTENVVDQPIVDAAPKVESIATSSGDELATSGDGDAARSASTEDAVDQPRVDAASGDDPRAGVSRENRDAIEAPRPDTSPDEPGEAA